MNRFKKLTGLTFLVLFVSLFSAGNVYGLTSPPAPGRFENPQWAPPYYQGVRYYYLPDIETYYDINSQEFVYLYDGQWSFSRECPSVNHGFDLNNCFAVALDVTVFRPWMHHHYYVSHYPRYYYQDYYDHSNIPYVRGFNENSRSAIYWRENERNRARNWNNEGLRNNHNFRYSNYDRQQQQNWNRNGYDNRRNGYDNSSRQQQQNRNMTGNDNRQNGNDNSNRQQQRDVNNTPRTTTPAVNNNQDRKQTVATPASVRTTQTTNYYGKTIGQPVKVEKQMRDQQDNSKTDNSKTDTKNNDNRNNDNRR